MYTERRKQPRVPKTFTLHVERAAATGGGRDEPLPAELVDVAMGGIGFTTTQPLAASTRLRVTVDVETLGEAQPYTVQVTSPAVVHWCRRRTKDSTYLVGVQFVDTPPPMADKWMTELSSLTGLTHYPHQGPFAHKDGTLIGERDGYILTIGPAVDGRQSFIKHTERIPSEHCRCWRHAYTCAGISSRHVEQ